MAAIAVALWSERRRGPNPAERVAHPAQAAALLALAAVLALGSWGSATLHGHELLVSRT